MTDRIISVGEIRRGSLRQVQSLGFEPRLAPPRLVTLAARYRRSPEGCFESRLVVSVAVVLRRRGVVLCGPG